MALMAPGSDVSALTLNRLSLYLRCLRDLETEGVKTISSLELAERFHLSAPQIRKDLAQFGEFGIRGVGYDVNELGERLNRRLGLDHTHPLVIVGMGNLGSALAQFLNFPDHSFKVVAAVDNDRRKIGRRVGDVVLRDSSELEQVIEESGAEIGVLTVPARAAQENYEALAGAGVKAVLNFAPVRLDRIPGIPTKTVDLRVHLEELGFLLQHTGRDKVSTS